MRRPSRREGNGLGGMLDRPMLPRALVALLCASGGAAFAQCAPASAGTTSLCAPVGPAADTRVMGQRTSGIQFVHSLDERWGGGDASRAVAPGDSGGAGTQPLTLRVAGQGIGTAVGNGALQTDTRTGTARFGGDTSQWSLFSGTGKLHLGTMAGYDGNRSDPGTPGGGSAGLYGTWYQDDRSRLGWYTDVYGQFAWLDNNNDAPWVNRSNYASNAGMASAEAGYSLQLGDTSPWTVRPQGQLIYLRSNNYNLADTDFTTIDGMRRNGWMSRLGVRVQPPGFQTWGLKMRPYAALNWWHDELNSEVIAPQYTTTSALAPSNRYELKTGLNVDVAPGMAAWGDLGLQWGQQSYQAWTLRAGMRYAW